MKILRSQACSPRQCFSLLERREASIQAFKHSSTQAHITTTTTTTSSNTGSVPDHCCRLKVLVFVLAYLIIVGAHAATVLMLTWQHQQRSPAESVLHGAHPNPRRWVRHYPYHSWSSKSTFKLLQ